MAALLRLLLSGLFLLRGAAGDTPPTPLPTLLCSMVGPGGVLSPHPALLRLRAGKGETPPEAEPLQDPPPASAVTFDISDPWAALSPAWGPAQDPPPRCELSPTVPNALPPPWAPSLAPPDGSPPTLGGSWWLLTLETPKYAVTSLLRGRPPPGGAAATPAPGTATAVTATLSVSTLTPELSAPPGSPLALQCSFAAPPGSPFALEWLQRRRGGGRRLLAYDSARGVAPGARPGAGLLLGGGGEGPREVSLRLDPLRVAHHGTFVCALSLPHGSAQQLLRLRVMAPPQVSLRPQRLVVAPGATPEVLCEASGYFPLEASIRWEWREGRGAGGRGAPAESWSGAPRRAADGSYSRSAGARLAPVRPRHHGSRLSCVVAHPALPRPRSATISISVAGWAGPGLEDLGGLCLVAFSLCWLWDWLCPAPPRQEEDPKKTQ